MKRGKWFLKKGLTVLLVATAALLLFGFIVMTLWNAILPAVIHAGTLTFGQALGLLVLCKILFGGFHGPWRGGPGSRWKQGMKDRWLQMTPEDREKFKQDWKGRCAAWKRPAEEAPGGGGPAF
jgi:hypothetical protein